MKMRSVLLGSALAIAFVAACGGGTTGPGTSPAGSAPPAGGSTVEVGIANFAFEPAEATVAAGGTVRWTNSDSAPHSVSWADGEPESPDLNTGDDYERTFATAGTYAYSCGIHPTMTGSVTVTQ